MTMKINSILAIILAIVLTVACSPIHASAGGISNADREAINAARTARSNAIANRDAAAAAAVSTEDGVILPPNLPPR
jgi:hypothetical protein